MYIYIYYLGIFHFVKCTQKRKNEITNYLHDILRDKSNVQYHELKIITR